MKKWIGFLLAILLIIMASYPVCARENDLLYYSPQYTSLSQFKDGVAIYTVNDQLGFLDTNGKESLLRTGEYLWHGKNIVILRDSNVIYGYTYSKEKLFEFECTSVYGILDKMIVVEVDGEIGVINFNGETIFACGNYDMVRIKDSTSIWYSEGGIWYEYSLLDNRIKELSYIPLVSISASCCIGIDTNIGLYKDNEAIINPNYTSYFVTGDEYVFVGNEGSCIYDIGNGSIIKLDGKKIMDYDEFGYTYYSISDDVVHYVSHDNTVSNEYDMMYVSVPSDEYMVISDELNQYSYCSISGVESTQKTWNIAYRFKEGYALCCDYIDNNKANTQWYIINEDFEIVKTLDYDVYVDTTYPASTDFSDGYIRTIDRDTGLMGFIRLDEFSNEDISRSCTVTGQITSSDSNTASTSDDTITIILSNDANKYTEIVVSSGVNSAVEYSIEDVAAGTYTMTVSKQNHVTREYEIIVDGDEVKQDVTICLIGDVNMNGSITSADALQVRQYIAGLREFDDYKVLLADVNQKNGVTATDALWILQRIAGIRNESYTTIGG